MNVCECVLRSGGYVDKDCQLCGGDGASDHHRVEIYIYMGFVVVVLGLGAYMLRSLVAQMTTK